MLGLLADGVGGRSGGALASEQVVTTAQRRFDEHGPNDPIERFFEDLVAEIHVVLQLAGTTASLQPHSTLVAVLVQPSASTGATSATAGSTTSATAASRTGPSTTRSANSCCATGASPPTVPACIRRARC